MGFSSCKRDSRVTKFQNHVRVYDGVGLSTLGSSSKLSVRGPEEQQEAGGPRTSPLSGGGRTRMDDATSTREPSRCEATPNHHFG